MEEYKALDGFCAQAYGVEHGVTNYIETMKGVSPPETLKVQGWKENLDRLQKYRKIRNILVHEEGSLERDLLTMDDIKWIQNFHQKLLHTTDPLAILYKKNTAQKNTNIKHSSPLLDQKVSAPKEDSEMNSVVFVLLVIGIVIVIFSIILVLKIVLLDNIF